MLWSSVSRSHLQLRAASVPPHVVGEGGGAEPPCRLPVRQEQVDHEPPRGSVSGARRSRSESRYPECTEQ